MIRFLSIERVWLTDILLHNLLYIKLINYNLKIKISVFFITVNAMKVILQKKNGLISEYFTGIQ